MNGNSSNILIVAIAALALVITVLVFISINPWLLFGVPPVLWAIASIIRAIHGSTGDDQRPDDIRTADDAEVLHNAGDQ